MEAWTVSPLSSLCPLWTSWPGACASRAPRAALEREFNGPVVGLQERYREGLATLGSDFTEVDGHEQRRRLRDDEAFCELLWGHCCEGMYGAPEYGGNRDTVGWEYIDFEGDVQPRGYTDAEVSQP